MANGGARARTPCSRSCSVWPEFGWDTCSQPASIQPKEPDMQIPHEAVLLRILLDLARLEVKGILLTLRRNSHVLRSRQNCRRCVHRFSFLLAIRPKKGCDSLQTFEQLSCERESAKLPLAVFPLHPARLSSLHCKGHSAYHEMNTNSTKAIASVSVGLSSASDATVVVIVVAHLASVFKRQHTADAPTDWLRKKPRLKKHFAHLHRGAFVHRVVFL